MKKTMLLMSLFLVTILGIPKSYAAAGDVLVQVIRHCSGATCTVITTSFLELSDGTFKVSSTTRIVPNPDYRQEQ